MFLTTENEIGKFRKKKILDADLDLQELFWLLLAQTFVYLVTQLTYFHTSVCFLILLLIFAFPCFQVLIWPSSMPVLASWVCQLLVQC